jgi:hypothetical protein
MSSCSLFKGNKQEDFGLKSLGKDEIRRDYLEHISTFGQMYESIDGQQSSKLNYRTQKYLQSVINKIKKNNELFFKDKKKYEVNIIKSNRPFHFSLPDKKIYLSTSLLNKYIKTEKLLLCILVFEMIRSEKDIYSKRSVIPTGIMDAKRILSLLRLKTQQRIELHKWAYYLLKRSGVDTDLYLSWLQILNRNSLDFSLLLEGRNSISYEESQFKTFLIANVKQNIRQVRHERSPRQFYKFLYDVNKL